MDIKYDIIKNLLNNEKRERIEEVIADSIYQRLLQWGYSASHFGRNGDSKLSYHTVAITWKIFDRFRQGYGENKLIDELEGTQGWTCGLGQILDIQQKHILEILPYILTAYLYNFCEESPKGTRKWGRTDFVKKFYKKQIEKLKGFEIKEPDKTNRFLFGFADAPETFFYEAGIGKLLQGTFDTSSSKGMHRLKLFSKCFVFPETVCFPEYGIVVPKENEATVRSAIQTYGDNTYVEIDKGLNVRLDLSNVAFYEGIREYDPDVFESIFLMWYFVIHSAERELKTLGHDGKLNPIACRLLLERALGRNEKTQQIKRNIEEYGLEATQVSEGKRILDEYLNRLRNAENSSELTISFHVEPPELISEPVPSMSCGPDNAV